MASNTLYPNPPITEAIIDLRVAPLKADAADSLRALGAEEHGQYPIEEELFSPVGKMEWSPSGDSASVERHLRGWRFCSQDRKQVFQARFDGFTFSRLAPYQSWEVSQRESQRLWGKYRRTVGCPKVVRLAVRYINRIDVPLPSIDLKEYFRTSPEISPELPQMLDGFFFQLKLPFPEIQAHCLLNQTIIPPNKEGTTSVVLDIDLFRVAEMPQDEQDIWAIFEQLHDQENTIFEHCITDKTRSLFYASDNTSSVHSTNG